MHHARRSLQVVAFGVRASSSRVNPAPISLGGLAESQPEPSSNGPSSDKLAFVPKSKSWARPSPPKPAPSPPLLDRWDRRVDRREEAPEDRRVYRREEAPEDRRVYRREEAPEDRRVYRREEVPEDRHADRREEASEDRRQERREDSGRWGRFTRVPSPSMSQRERGTPPHQASTSSSILRDLAPHQASAGVSSPVRDAAPHRGLNGPASVQRQQHPRQPKSQKGDSVISPHSLRNILRKDRIKSDLEGLEEEVVEDGKKAKPIVSALAAKVEISGDDVDVGEDTRGGKHVRYGSKAQGSIVARANASMSRSRGPASQNPTHKESKRKSQKTVKPVNLDIFIPSVVSVGNLARLLNVRLDNLCRKMVKVGMEAEASHDHMLTSEYASLLAMEYGRNPVVNDEAAFDIYPRPAPADSSILPYRPPVVTIMGHVDHGKTTLLDTLRSTSVAKGEAGGITQHIGAFSVPVPASGGEEGQTKTITFLDTPGHAAFSAMRARGARLTDIVVLVVAAEDGIMPQTREVIDLIKKDNLTAVVAINKIDKPGIDIGKVEKALLAEDIQLETFGGDVPAVQVSGLTGQGLDQLVETISLLSEMKDLQAERDGSVQGYIIESKVQKGLGPVATVLILRGCMKPGEHIICGVSHAKVKIMTDSNGKAVRAAYPGMAVTVSGWKELPQAGDEVLQGTESEVKKALANRIRKAEIGATLGDMEALNVQRRLEREQKEKEEGEEEAAVESEPAVEGPKELRLVIKADVSGSVEAVAGALEGIGNHLARAKVVATGVGDVNESDVLRAKAVNGTIVAFSVNTPRSIQTEASSQRVPILSAAIIYRLMDDVKARVAALLPPIMERRVTGEANVLQIFDIGLKGRHTVKVAGCRVANGVVEKNKMARIVRDGETVHEGHLGTMKHLKKDVTEAAKGTECGLAFEGWDDLREGDLIQMYQEIEKPATL